MDPSAERVLGTLLGVDLLARSRVRGVGASMLTSFSPGKGGGGAILSPIYGGNRTGRNGADVNAAHYVLAKQRTGDGRGNCKERSEALHAYDSSRAFIVQLM